MPRITKEQIQLPLLQLVADLGEFRLRDIVPQLADHFSLTDVERREVVPSGGTKWFDYRCGWAQRGMKEAGLVESTRLGYHRITARGVEVLGQNLESIDNRFLKQLRESLESSDSHLTPKSSCADDDKDGRTTEDSIDDNYQQIRKQLAAELLEQIKEKSPRFFEELVIDLLVKMGYGGSREDAEAVGRSGDGGIDGIINEDRLGLDVVYVQAKRWEGNVGRPEIHKFTGALIEKNARKGIFITTSDFSREARESADNSDDPKIVLIDGRQLAEFMIDHNVGVSTVKTYEIKRVDSDYFIETDDSQTQDS